MDKLDNKQMILLAIYTEYQKDLPIMKNVNFNSLGIEKDIFIVAIQKLQNEKLIHGATFTKGGRGTVPLIVYMDSVMMTNDGIAYVEGKLNIPTTLTGIEKVKEVSKKVTEWGYNELKDFTVKVIAELLKG